MRLPFALPRTRSGRDWRLSKLESQLMRNGAPIRTSQRIVQVCLFLFAAIGLFGGTLQMYLGQPETTPRLDNVHRFMAGIYLGTGIICLWAGATIRRQDNLVLLIGLAVLLAAVGRLISFAQVGVPEPKALWLGYLVPELLVTLVMIVGHLAGRRSAAQDRPTA
jgi:peptidoglycan/LPS O-acetylase OafA/YrhL